MQEVVGSPAGGGIPQNAGKSGRPDQWGPSNHVRPPGAPQLEWWLHKDRAWTISDLPEIKGQAERIAGLSGPLAEFLHGKRPPIATAEEGRDVLALVLACYESDTYGKRFHLKERDL